VDLSPGPKGLGASDEPSAPPSGRGTNTDGSDRVTLPDVASSLDPAALQSHLAELLAEHGVPGAALGVLHDGEITKVAAGVANLRTGVEATTDTVFELASIGKAWTTTVLMQLVDDGRVDLDAPVRTYLPNFSVADPEVSAGVTLRHLLSHTSGIDGDHFENFGRGDDALERYVASCEALGQTHPLGVTMSYCNTGFSIIGRVIEVLTGTVWDQAMRERLFAPLGLIQTGTLAEEAILHRVAAGHVAPAPGAPLEVAGQWGIHRAGGPMGGIASTVGETLAFARLHLEDGRTPEGGRILSEASARAMREPQIEVPDRFTLGSHWGLGWILFDWEGHHLYGHDGNSIGQSSYLRILPEANVAITLLTNGGEPKNVYRALFSEVLSELAGVTVPPLPQPLPVPVRLDLSRYAGTYERLAVRTDLAPQDGRLVGTVTVSGPLAEMEPNPVTNVTLTPVDETTFLLHEEGLSTPSPAVFFAFQDGVPGYLHTGARANPRKA
jgi:CubicO group peptidase (beta-lactamase class C family)